MHKFTGQFILIHDFLNLLSQMLDFSDDPRFKEVFHSFSTGFLPQSVFFLAQNATLFGQSKQEQLAE